MSPLSHVRLGRLSPRPPKCKCRFRHVCDYEFTWLGRSDREPTPWAWVTPLWPHELILSASAIRLTEGTSRYAVCLLGPGLSGDLIIVLQSYSECHNGIISQSHRWGASLQNDASVTEDLSEIVWQETVSPCVKKWPRHSFPHFAVNAFLNL